MSLGRLERRQFKPQEFSDANASQGIDLSCWPSAGVVGRGRAGQAQPSFTLVRVQTEIADPNEYDATIVKQVFGDTFAEGAQGSQYVKGRASFGNSGAYAVSGDDEHEAFAETWWADAFTVTGSTGQGALTISVSVSGALSGKGRANYGLFASDQPFSRTVLTAWLDCAPDRLDCIPHSPPGSQALIPLTASFGSGTTVLTATLSFTYGQPVYVASYFGAETWGVGEASFYGSAHFGITAPASTVLETGSGTTYLAATAVPEPGAMLMMAMGLAGLSVTRRRQRR